MPDTAPFDCVLLMAFGGPRSGAEVHPFLEHFLHGKNIPPQRLEEIARRYQLLGGHSGLPVAMQQQAEALAERLRELGLALLVRVGMLNWHPFIAEVLERLAGEGCRRVIALNTAAHHSPASCGQYREAVRQASGQLAIQGHPIEVAYTDSWFGHPLFVRAVVDGIREALEQLPSELRGRARIVFTAHSLPLSMARECRYREQLRTTAELVMDELQRPDWALVYQSRSGRPSEPWLEPDVRDYLRTERSRALAAAVVVPIGFVCDHLEVAYDLDHELAAICGEIELPMVRAATVGRDPAYIEMLAELVQRLCRRHEKYPPLPIVSR